MNIVAVIPARSGSKGLPDKNIRSLGGRPLMGYSIQAALNCREIQEVYLNSDHRDYLDLGVGLGARPYLRPKELAQDDTPMKSVIVEFIGRLKQEGRVFDAVVVLYPVYPFRNEEDVARMITAFENIGGCRPLVGLKEPSTHPFLCYKLLKNNRISACINNDKNIYYRRQVYPKYYEFTLWACVLPVSSLDSLNAELFNDEAYGYIIPNNKQTMEIDSAEDLDYAEFFLQKTILAGR